MNACLAHNIYITFKDYKKSYSKRIIFYKYSALILCGVVLILTLFNLNFIKISRNDENFTFLLYNKGFILIFYFSGFATICYILHKIYYIVMKNDDSVNLILGKIFYNFNKFIFKIIPEMLLLIL